MRTTTRTMPLQRRRIGSSHAAWLLAVLCISTIAQPVAAESTMQVIRLSPALDRLIAPDARIERIATGFQFTEGPMWREGRLWFSDLGANRVMAVSRSGEVQQLIEDAPPFAPNGMVTDRDGTVLLAQQSGRRIVRVDAQLHMHPFLEHYQGKRLNSPNDLVLAPDGALWFTDPSFGLSGGDQDPARELPFNAVYRYFQGELTPVVKDLTLPNGLALTHDGRTLYVANYGPAMFIMAYDISTDGHVTGQRKLIDHPAPASGRGGPDGLKLDTAGNIWATGPGGTRIITPQGEVLGQIVLPEVAANLAFGEDGHAVYFTASSSIYRLPLRTRGMMPLHQR